jgi:uncharacterized membrane protein YeaQ/YmgE (transglycosylase-associated protein family)
MPGNRMGRRGLTNRTTWGETTMVIIWALIVGLVVGVLARLVLPGRQNVPLWLTILLGLVGALAGNWLASLLGVRHTSGIDWIRHILQVAVAAVLISLASAGRYRSRV